METEGKTITCKAAVAWEPGKPLSIETIEVAPPKAGEVRVKVVATGVCASDDHAIKGKIATVKFPVIAGHESCGIVESVGEGVKSVKSGDHVMLCFLPQCRECKLCKHDDTNLCTALCSFTAPTPRDGFLLDQTSRFSCNGKTLYHFLGTSTFSEYTVADEASVCKINDSAPSEKVCLIGCGISTGYGAALNAAKVKPRSKVAVWGLGGIGLAACMGAKKAGASRIIGIDINPEKFELAKKFGITDFVNPKDHDKPIQEVLKSMTDGGLDYTFECVGNIDAVKAAIESCHIGWGTCVVVGVPPANALLSTTPYHLLCGITLKGTFFGGWKSRDNIPDLVEDYMSGDLLLDDFVTYEKTLDEINEAFQLLYSGKVIRTVLRF